MHTVAIRTSENKRNDAAHSLKSIAAETWSAIESAGTIMLCPQFGHHLDARKATHIDTVRGLLDAIRERSQAKIFIAGASETSTKSAFRNFGFENLPREYSNVFLRDLNDCETITLDIEDNKGTLMKFLIAKPVAKADVRIYISDSTDPSSWALRGWVPSVRFGSTGPYWPRWSLQEEFAASFFERAVRAFADKTPADLVITIDSA